jgi:hypothetical protein
VRVKLHHATFWDLFAELPGENLATEPISRNEGMRKMTVAERGGGT